MSPSHGQSWVITRWTKAGGEDFHMVDGPDCRYMRVVAVDDVREWLGYHVDALNVEEGLLGEFERKFGTEHASGGRA